MTPFGGGGEFPSAPAPPAAAAGITELLSPHGTIAIGGSASVQDLDIKIPLVVDHIISNKPIGTAEGTWLATNTLSIGQWIVDVTALINAGAAANIVELTTIQGTAVATFDGAFSAEVTGLLGIISVHYTFMADVTTAGTLLLRSKTSATTGTPAVNASSTSYGNVSGYTASLANPVP